MQIAADELDVPINMIDLIESDTWLTPDQGTTSGSQSVKTNFGGGLRRGCAEARQALIQMAANKLGVPANTLVTREGAVVSSADSSKRATYGELIGGQRFNLKSTGRAPLKKPAELKVVGRSISHVDIPQKVQAKLEYIQNLKVPGMLHGRVVRPPGINAKLVSVDGFKTRIPDLVKVVVQKDFVGVVAKSEAGAIRAAQELKVTWKDPGGVATNYDALYAEMAKRPAQSRLLVSDGNVDKALAGAAKVDRGDLLLPVPAARVDGPVLRGCRGEGGRGDSLVADAGRLSTPHGRSEGARLQGPAGARDLQGGLRLLRPQRRGHRLDRRGADVEGGRCTGARPVDACGRAHLGALRNADGVEGQGRPRRRRQRHRLGLREPPGLAWRPPRQRRRGEPPDRSPDRAHAPVRPGRALRRSRRSARTTRTRLPVISWRRRVSSRTPA